MITSGTALLQARQPKIFAPCPAEEMTNAPASPALGGRYVAVDYEDERSGSREEPGPDKRRTAVGSSNEGQQAAAARTETSVSVACAASPKNRAEARAAELGYAEAVRAVAKTAMVDGQSTAPPDGGARKNVRRQGGRQTPPRDGSGDPRFLPPSHDADGVRFVRLYEGSFFGEVALLLDQPRNASVLALGKVGRNAASLPVLVLVTKKLGFTLLEQSVSILLAAICFCSSATRFSEHKLRSMVLVC